MTCDILVTFIVYIGETAETELAAQFHIYPNIRRTRQNGFSYCGPGYAKKLVVRFLETEPTVIMQYIYF